MNIPCFAARGKETRSSACQIKFSYVIVTMPMKCLSRERGVLFVSEGCSQSPLASHWMSSLLMMASGSPLQERQLVLMEKMNRRLESIVESQRKLEETNARLQQENSRLKTELARKERVQTIKRGSKRSCRESSVEVPMDLRVCFLFDALVLLEMFERLKICAVVLAECVNLQDNVSSKAPPAMHG